MRWMRADEERGWILLETAVLGLLVLATAAALSIFARTALLADLTSARTEAALAARAQFSLMEAELDQGILPLSEAAEIQSHEHRYHVEKIVTRTEEFYDVSLRLSWQILGREEQAEFVRRLTRHVQVQSSP